MAEFRCSFIQATPIRLPAPAHADLLLRSSLPASRGGGCEGLQLCLHLYPRVIVLALAAHVASQSASPSLLPRRRRVLELANMEGSNMGSTESADNSTGVLRWVNTSNFKQGPTQYQFQLDIVGFLAILGEGSVESLAQVITLSNFVFVPRLLPAPQIFLKPSRPEKLESVSNAKVVGVHSGNNSEDIHHVAHAIHRGDKLPPNTVECVTVTEDESLPRPSPKRYSFLTFLALLGFAMSATLFGLSMWKNDGMALLAVISLSLLSTVAGVANKWSPTPNNPKPDEHSPPGDVVIKYPQGAFIVVKCSERTARYLYFNPSERCIYLIRNTSIYRGLSLISTLLLMVGVITLANATIVLQAAVAASYIGINVFYWIGAALPPAQHWDLRRIKVTKVEVRGGHPPKGATIENVSPTFTEALWKAIAVTQRKDWLVTTQWAPKTKAWNEWLAEAEEAAQSEPMKTKVEKDENGGTHEIWQIRNWDSRHVLSTILRSNTERFQKLDV